MGETVHQGLLLNCSAPESDQRLPTWCCVSRVCSSLANMNDDRDNYGTNFFYLSRWILKRHDEMWCTFKVETVIIFTKCQFHEIVALVKGSVRQTEMRTETEPESVG